MLKVTSVRKILIHSAIRLSLYKCAMAFMATATFNNFKYNIGSSLASSQ